MLDFWTFCCVNCMHVLPELAALERRFAAQPVTVVGVHSAKFDNEKDARAVRSAVLRCALGHHLVPSTRLLACMHRMHSEAFTALYGPKLRPPVNPSKCMDAMHAGMMWSTQ